MHQPGSLREKQFVELLQEFWYDACSRPSATFEARNVRTSSTVPPSARTGRRFDASALSGLRGPSLFTCRHPSAVLGQKGGRAAKGREKGCAHRGHGNGQRQF